LRAYFHIGSARVLARLDQTEQAVVEHAEHVASATVETRNQMGFKALDNIAAVLAGRCAISPV